MKFNITFFGTLKVYCLWNKDIGCLLVTSEHQHLSFYKKKNTELILYQMLSMENSFSIPSLIFNNIHNETHFFKSNMKIEFKDY
jgi:hypothetical protein